MKVKIHRKEIIDLCNWKHEDFGCFANFLNGLLKDGYLECDGEIVSSEKVNELYSGMTNVKAINHNNQNNE